MYPAVEKFSKIKQYFKKSKKLNVKSSMFDLRSKIKVII